jgi:hypothetical protein
VTGIGGWTRVSPGVAGGQARDSPNRLRDRTKVGRPTDATATFAAPAASESA